MYTRGNWARVVTTLRRSDAIVGVSALIGGTVGPRLRVPKYFCTSGFTAAGS